LRPSLFTLAQPAGAGAARQQLRPAQLHLAQQQRLAAAAGGRRPAAMSWRQTFGCCFRRTAFTIVTLLDEKVYSSATVKERCKTSSWPWRSWHGPTRNCGRAMRFLSRTDGTTSLRCVSSSDSGDVRSSLKKYEQAPAPYQLLKQQNVSAVAC
jgi:hypothetical protein